MINESIFVCQPEADTGKLCSTERAQVFESDYIDSDVASDNDISGGEQQTTSTRTHTHLHAHTT